MKVNLLVSIDREIHQNFKIYCIKKNEKMSVIISDFLERLLNMEKINKNKLVSNESIQRNIEIYEDKISQKKERDEKVLSYRAMGYSYRKIEKLTGVPQNTVCRIVNKYLNK